MKRNTPIQEVYDFFLSKLSTNDYDNFSDEELEEELLMTFKRAMAKSKSVLGDITVDYIRGQFNTEIDYELIDIISNWMVYVHFTPRINSTNNYEQMVNQKDFQMYSQANHIKEIRELYKDIKKETNTMMVAYTYNHMRKKK